MKKYIEFKRKITKGGGTSTSYRITIPEEIINKMEAIAGENITWRVYDNSNKVEIIFENTKPSKILTDKQKSQNHKKYIKGSKKKGYYIVNNEKNINIGAYATKDMANATVDILVSGNWSKQDIEASKLNIEYDITSERFPHVRNYNPYYYITEEQYNKIYQDTKENTPFKNISYDELQSIIEKSLSN